MSSGDLERFLSYVDQDGPQVPGMARRCWEWNGAIDAKGRPRFCFRKQGVLAKRALIDILTGNKLSADCNVVSICRNRLCVRPEHLALCNHIDARALSPTGRIGLGDAALIVMQHEEGYTLNELAMFNSVSVRLVEAIIQECERYAAI